MESDETVGRIVQLFFQHHRQQMIGFLPEENDLADFRLEIIVWHRHCSDSDVRARLIATELHLANTRCVFAGGQFYTKTSYENGKVRHREDQHGLLPSCVS